MSDLEMAALEESMQDAMVYGQQRRITLAEGDFREAIADRLAAVRSLLDTANVVSSGPLLNEGELRSRLSTAMLSATTWQGLDSNADLAVEVIDQGLRARYSGQLDPTREAPTIESVRATMLGNHEVSDQAYQGAGWTLAQSEDLMRWAKQANVATSVSASPEVVMPSNVVHEAIAEVYKIPSLGEDLAFDQPYMNSGANGLQARVEVQRVPPFEADNTPPSVVLQVSLEGAKQGRLEVVNYDLDGNERAVEAHELGGLRDRLYLDHDNAERLVQHLQPALAQMVNAYAPRPAEQSVPVARDETLERISRLREANFPRGLTGPPDARGEAAVSGDRQRVAPSHRPPGIGR